MFRFLQLFLAVLFIATNQASAQTTNDITSISLEIYSSFHIPDHHLIIDVGKGSDSCRLHLLSFPMQKFKKKYPVRDTLFFIDTTEFLKLAQAVSLLNGLDIVKAKEHGFDGNICTIRYGSPDVQRIYRIWSPDYDTNNRGLNDYYNACYAIIKAAHLPFKILF